MYINSLKNISSSRLPELIYCLNSVTMLYAPLTAVFNTKPVTLTPSETLQISPFQLFLTHILIAFCHSDNWEPCSKSFSAPLLRLKSLFFLTLLSLPHLIGLSYYHFIIAVDPVFFSLRLLLWWFPAIPPEIDDLFSRQAAAHAPDVLQVC